jgi:hypothetical protein
MESVGSQEPATVPCPEPDESNPHHTLQPYFHEIHFNIALPFTPRIEKGKK